MTQPLPDNLLDEVHDLTLACLSGEASPADMERLDALLFDNEAARVAYANIIRESLSLRRWAKAGKVRSEELMDGGGSNAAGPAPVSDSVPGVAHDCESSGVGGSSPDDFSGLAFLGRGSHGMAGSFSSGWPMAYLTATMILGIGLIIGALTHVSHSLPIAAHSPPARQNLPPSAPRLEIVGRITEMVDCQWSDESTAGINGADVPLGRKYALSSGLMEITYDSGAKVILQGPVTYEVESVAGGYLSAGKLTAKLDKRSAASGQQSESSNPQSLIPNPSLPPAPCPLFSVRTPTAVVTDLGTEFGVEVTETQASLVHVFQGSVELHAMAGDRVRKTIRMVEHESARVQRGDDGNVGAVKDAAIVPASFIRSEHLQNQITEQQQAAFRRWKAHFENICRDPALVAYYDFQRRDDSPGVLHAVSNVSKSDLHGAIQGAVWTAGRMPGKQALQFDDDQARVIVSLPQRLTQMTLATSVAIKFISDDTERGSGGLLMSDGWGVAGTSPEKCHWQLLRSGEICFSTVASGRRMTAPVLPWQDWGRQRWRHLAVVADPAARQMTAYLDGEAVLTEAIPEGFAATFDSAQIGNWLPIDGHQPRVFCGRMDEFLIVARAMTADEIRAMFEAGRR